MPHHVVEQGECLTQIAVRHGFADTREILSHPDNAEYFASRPDPNVLFPGDRLFVPEITLGEEARPTGKRHRFVAKQPARSLHIVLKRQDGTPIAGVPYRLVVGALTAEGKTDGDGALREPIPVDANAAQLLLDGVPFDLDIGYLDPMFDAPDGGVSGVQARLANLGVPCPDSGVLDDETRSAIDHYRRTRKIAPAAGIDDALRRALAHEHGS